MMPPPGRQPPGGLPVCAKVGLAATLTAVGLAAVDPRWAALPLAGYVLACVFLPFFPRSSFFLPVISRGNSGQRAVALTFDDGPDPLSTPALLQLLARNRIQATFFVLGQKARAHPELIRQILDQGHDIGNHSYRHDTLVMFKGARRIEAEIAAAQKVLESLGILPRFFRPPAGITYPGLGRALAKNRLLAVNYSCRACDRGNRRIHGLSGKILGRLRPDDIVLLHDIRPSNPALMTAWLLEVQALVNGILSAGMAIRPLGEIIGQPVISLRAS